ncbi:MAG: hypothetical protein J2P17_19075, partial [Mycobacterium sp.]|nr:hypothetical protein [Mycobacterium sp.]
MRKARGVTRVGLGVAVVMLFGASAATAAVGNDPFGAGQVGRQPNGSILIPDNQFVTPAGSQVEFAGNPLSAAVRPDGKTAVALNGKTSDGGNGLNVVDLTTRKLIDTTFSLRLDHMWGLSYSPDGNTLYATGSTGSTGKIVVMSVAADGSPTVQKTIALPTAHVGGNINPLDITNGPEGKSLLVALSRDNSLGVVDAQTGDLTARVPVGNAPTGVTVVGNTAYVTNQGGRAAQPGDSTIDSGGTQIVTDPAVGYSTTGTVSVVDLATNTVKKTIPVGLQPERMTVYGRYLFVTNTNSDTVSVIDTQSDSVVQTIDVRPYPHAPLGSEPNAVRMVNGDQLVVSLARDNALAVYRWNGPASTPHLEGLVPTAWFPDDIAVDSAHGTLVVTNTQGVGALGADQSHAVNGTNATGHSSFAQIGSVSVIPFPTVPDLAHGTHQVYSNNNWFGINGRNATGDRTTPAVAMPTRIGEPSTIKHVFYIIKENRTYDQVLGDVGKGNGDASLTQFGQQVTPNAHQFAKTFPLLDNFYTNGIESVAGHQWTTQATNPDYEEKEVDSDNVRGHPGGVRYDALANSSTGHLWDDALAHNVSAVDFGEHVYDFSGPEPFGTWTNWYNDYLVLSGQKSGSPHVPVGDYKATSDLPNVNSILYRTFPTNTQSIPDQYRAQIFLDAFNNYVKNNNLPQFSTIWLPDDHTAGTSKGLPTPQSMVADNDLAVGKIVDAISHSPYWKDSAIFITEDDSQDGVDHVDGHREPAFVISPWVKRGVVNSHYWTILNMMRSMEQILGLP